MHTNETGREPTEPTEPTDAVRQCQSTRMLFGALWQCQCIYGHDGAHEYVPELAGKRPSYSAPMPDTPAPDEVAHCTDERIVQRFERWWNDEGSGMAPHDEEEHCSHAERVSRIAWMNGGDYAHAHIKELSDMVIEIGKLAGQLRTDNAALTARVAELEAELADAKRMVCAVQPSDDHESLYCHDTVFRGVEMNWFDARDKMLSDNARRLAGEGGGNG